MYVCIVYTIRAGKARWVSRQRETERDGKKADDNFFECRQASPLS